MLSPMGLHMRKLIMCSGDSRRPLSTTQLTTLSTRISHLEELTCFLKPTRDEIWNYTFPLALKKLSVTVVIEHEYCSVHDVHDVLSSIAMCTNLISLELDFHAFSKFDVTSGFHQLSRLTKLSTIRLLFGNRFGHCLLTPAQWEIISHMPSLTRIDLQRGVCIYRDHLDALAKDVDCCARLKYLNVEGVVLNSAIWEGVLQFKALTEIHFHYPQGADRDRHMFNPLAQLSCLSHVDLKCYPHVDLDSLMTTLTKLKELRMLELYHEHLTSAHLERLLPEVPLLSFLNVKYCPSLTSVRFLSTSRTASTTLTSLYLPKFDLPGHTSELSLPSDFFVFMEPLKSLTSLHVGRMHNLMKWTDASSFPMTERRISFLQHCNLALRDMYTAFIHINSHCV